MSHFNILKTRTNLDSPDDRDRTFFHGIDKSNKSYTSEHTVLFLYQCKYLLVIYVSPPARRNGSYERRCVIFTNNIVSIHVVTYGVEPQDYPPTSLLQHLGPVLRRQRLNAGVSQVAMAEIIGCVPHALSSIETGKRAPSLPMLIAICDNLGVSVTQVVAESEALANLSRFELRPRFGFGSSTKSKDDVTTSF